MKSSKVSAQVIGGPPTLQRDSLQRRSTADTPSSLTRCRACGRVRYEDCKYASLRVRADEDVEQGVRREWSDLPIGPADNAGEEAMRSVGMYPIDYAFCDSNSKGEHLANKSLESVLGDSVEDNDRNANSYSRSLDVTNNDFVFNAPDLSRPRTPNHTLSETLIKTPPSESKRDIQNKSATSLKSALRTGTADAAPRKTVTFVPGLNDNKDRRAWIEGAKQRSQQRKMKANLTAVIKNKLTVKEKIRAFPVIIMMRNRQYRKVVRKGKRPMLRPVTRKEEKREVRLSEKKRERDQLVEKKENIKRCRRMLETIEETTTTKVGLPVSNKPRKGAKNASNTGRKRRYVDNMSRLDGVQSSVWKTTLSKTPLNSPDEGSLDSEDSPKSSLRRMLEKDHGSETKRNFGKVGICEEDEMSQLELMAEGERVEWQAKLARAFERTAATSLKIQKRRMRKPCWAFDYETYDDKIHYELRKVQYIMNHRLSRAERLERFGCLFVDISDPELRELVETCRIVHESREGHEREVYQKYPRVWERLIKPLIYRRQEGELSLREVLDSYNLRAQRPKVRQERKNIIDKYLDIDCKMEYIHYTGPLNYSGKQEQDDLKFKKKGEWPSEGSTSRPTPLERCYRLQLGEEQHRAFTEGRGCLPPPFYLVPKEVKVGERVIEALVWETNPKATYIPDPFPDRDLSLSQQKLKNLQYDAQTAFSKHLDDISSNISNLTQDLDILRHQLQANKEPEEVSRIYEQARRLRRRLDKCRAEETSTTEEAQTIVDNFSNVTETLTAGHKRLKKFLDISLRDGAGQQEYPASPFFAANIGTVLKPEVEPLALKVAWAENMWSKCLWAGTKKLYGSHKLDGSIYVPRIQMERKLGGEWWRDGFGEALFGEMILAREFAGLRVPGKMRRVMEGRASSNLFVEAR